MHIKDQTLTELQNLFGDVGLGTNLFVFTVAKNKRREARFLEWCNTNRNRINELSAVVKQLDEEGLKTFGRSITFHSKEVKLDVVQCAKNTLKQRQRINNMLTLRRCISSHGKRKPTLANGLKCVITHCGNRGWFIDWSVCIKLKKRRKIRLELNINQTVRLLQNATKKIAGLKRLKPAKIDYWNGRNWIVLQPETHETVMKAIAEKTSLETIILLST